MLAVFYICYLAIKGLIALRDRPTTVAMPFINNITVQLCRFLRVVQG